MEDFGHGIVDSRHVVLLATVVGGRAAAARVARLRGLVPLDAQSNQR